VIGRYTIGTHEPEFGADGTTVLLRGTDGFKRFMDDTWPGLWGRPRTWSRLAAGMARKYGMGFVGDESQRVPHKERKRRVRRGKKKGKRTATVRTSAVKNAGESDALMLKNVAGFAQFMHPKVRWVEGNSDFARQLEKDHQLIENVDNRDVLFFRRANLQRQSREVPGLDFVYRYKAGRPATVESFSPTWDVDDVPVAVRVSGIIGQGARRRVLTVEAELVGPEKHRRRSALLRDAARQKDPARKALLEAQAASISDDVSFTRVQTRKVRKQDERTFVNASTAMVEVLDNERRAGIHSDWEANDPRRQRKVQTMRRETLRTVFTFRDGQHLQDFARSWLLTRLQLHLTATAEAANIPGLELVYPQQIHELSRASVEYDGLWMMKRCTHRWTSSGHSARLAMDRVPRFSSQISTQTRSAES
jgi:hypothetical protein